jgi:hypothetical protein
MKRTLAVGGDATVKLTAMQLGMIEGMTMATWEDAYQLCWGWQMDEEYNRYLTEGWTEWDGLSYGDIVAKKLAMSMDREMLKHMFP